MPYRIAFDGDAKRDLSGLRRYDQTRILDAVERWLTNEPAKEIGSRIVALEQPAVSRYRLRVGEFRVYYDVFDDDEEVFVVRVREKGRRSTGEVVEDAGG